MATEADVRIQGMMQDEEEMPASNDEGAEPALDGSDEPAPPSHRAPALLAVVRVFSVLGMSFFVAFGIFLLLLPSWIPALLSILAAIPFFFLMRFFERFSDTEEATEA